MKLPGRPIHDVLKPVDRIFRFLRTYGVLAFVGVFVSGCDDTLIDPFNNDGRYFTVYGFLDQSQNFQSATEHTLRVIPVTRTVERIEDPSQPQASIDARVFTTDLSTGETVEWRHTLQRLENGRYGHVFRSRFFVQPNRMYRLEVIRSDGITTSAETRIPDVSPIRPLLAAPNISQDSSVVKQIVTLPQTIAVWDLDVIYHVAGSSCFTSSRVAVPYERSGVRENDGWSLTIDISGDKQFLSNQVGNVVVCAMGMQAKILDAEWQIPEDVLNSEELPLPTSLSNVENGYGFFGSIALFQYDWPLSNELAEVLNRSE